MSGKTPLTPRLVTLNTSLLPLKSSPCAVVHREWYSQSRAKPYALCIWILSFNLGTWGKPSKYQAAAALAIVEQAYCKGKKVLIPHFLCKFLVFHYEQKTSKMWLHQDPASGRVADTYLMEAAANISGVFQICHQFMREYSKNSYSLTELISNHSLSSGLLNQDFQSRSVCRGGLFCHTLTFWPYSALCDGVGLWVGAVVSNGTLRNVTLLLQVSLSYRMQLQCGELGTSGSSVGSTVAALVGWGRASFVWFGRLCTLHEEKDKLDSDPPALAIHLLWWCSNICNPTQVMVHLIVCLCLIPTVLKSSCAVIHPRHPVTPASTILCFFKQWSPSWLPVASVSVANHPINLLVVCCVLLLFPVIWPHTVNFWCFMFFCIPTDNVSQLECEKPLPTQWEQQPVLLWVTIPKPRANGLVVHPFFQFSQSSHLPWVVYVHDWLTCSLPTISASLTASGHHPTTLTPNQTDGVDVHPRHPAASWVLRLGIHLYYIHWNLLVLTSDAFTHICPPPRHHPFV